MTVTGVAAPVMTAGKDVTSPTEDTNDLAAFLSDNVCTPCVANVLDSGYDMPGNRTASQLGHSIRSSCDDFTVLLLMFFEHRPSSRSSQRGIFTQKSGQDTIT